MTTNSSQSDATRAESTEASPAPPSKKGKISKLFGTSFLNVRQSTMTDDKRAEREVNLYLNYPFLCIDESPLRWWKIETARLPLLSTVARKYLSVCATSIPSERVFSVGGNIVTSKHNALKPEKSKPINFFLQRIYDSV